MKVLVTGAAGFIGMHVAQILLKRGDEVVGIDNLNDYYDSALKLARLEQLKPWPGFRFIKDDISDRMVMEDLFEKGHFDAVINLAAQAGVRYSLKNPHAYVQSNIVGFANLLEGCRHHGVKHFVYASSSSVYGANTKIPFSTHDPVNHPVSLYAASKKANELMAHTYSHLYGLPTTGLRYFTVYGPWGRPDMSPWLFTSAILEGRTIDVFNHGDMMRDFTYIDDIADGTVKVLDRIPQGNPDFDHEQPRPRHQPRALPHLQHRQPHPGAADGLHRHHRKSARPGSEEEFPADAGRRRAGNLRGGRRPDPRHRLQAGDDAGVWDREVGGVVSEVQAVGLSWRNIRS